MDVLQDQPEGAGTAPTYLVPDEHAWVDDRASGRVPSSMLDEADRLGGGGRKLLASGQGGYHSTYSVVPPGYRMDLHRHDVDELFVVLAGSCTWLGDGRTVGAHSSVVLPAGVVHGYTVGSDGLTVLTITREPFETELVDGPPPAG